MLQPKKVAKKFNWTSCVKYRYRLVGTYLKDYSIYFIYGIDKYYLETVLILPQFILLLTLSSFFLPEGEHRGGSGGGR